MLPWTQDNNELPTIHQSCIQISRFSIRKVRSGNEINDSQDQMGQFWIIKIDTWLQRWEE